MRIAVLSPLPPFRGGISEFSAMLCRQLLDMGHRLRGFSYCRLYPGVLFPGKSQFNPGVSSPIPTSRTVDSICPISWLRTRKAIRSWNPDAVIAAWWHPFFAPAILVSLPSEVPAVILCHNVMPHDPFPLSGLLAGLVLRKAQSVVVHSRADFEVADALSPETRLVRLFHPIYDQYISASPERSRAREILGIEQGIRVILFFGLIRSYKGVPDLIKAFSGLDGDILLLIAGESYDDRDAIARAMEAPENAGRIIWVDRFVPDDRVGLYFRASDVVALPYREATQSGVGQIALSFGKVMVVTDRGGLPELVEEGRTGFVSSPGSPAELEASLRKALQLSNQPDIESKVLEKAAEFSWERYAHTLLDSLT